MKALFLTIIFTMLILFCFGQKTEIFRIDSFPGQGILLNKNWKWIAEDDINFSKPNFDDTNWQNIDPTKNVMSMQEFTKEGQIYWLRMSFSLNKSIEDQIMMVVNQMGASEIYLNGNLIQSFGIIHHDPNHIKAFDPNIKPHSFPVSSDSIQVIAIRYSLQPNVTYPTHFGYNNSTLSIRLNTTENSVSNYYAYIQQTTLMYFKGGVYAILCVLFFTLFIFFPSLKANFYFAIFNFLLAISWAIIFPIVKNPILIEEVFWMMNSILILQVIGYLFKLTSVYFILEQKRGGFFYGIVILGVASMLTGTFIYGWGWFLFGFLLTNILNLDIIRVAVIAVRNNKKGAWIIISGGLIYLISWFLFCLQFYLNMEFEFLGFINRYFFDIALLSIPVAFAIFLGYDFGITNSFLMQKLKENAELADEKHNILAIQNETLEKQVVARTNDLQHSLDNLKSAQAQLIQSEKMASLGELTAGIAHEIQNPLNFVNNFSEVSSELLDEMNEELEKGDIDEAKFIANDIKQNLDKINHHGKRADAIVKGMLEHSRISSGEKVPTDINALAEEYLRLSYHGMRAKDKSFNADFVTDFDPTLPKINLVPQEIGRVLLNIINNAFQACYTPQPPQGGETVPSVEVKTRVIKSPSGDLGVEISVSDNGPGIPDAIKTKIFQPFFTTKPTGQGTGLGLSLSYDIVKAHGGKIKVDSQPGLGTTFTLLLPIH